MISQQLSQDMMGKLASKIEAYSFVQMPKATPEQLVELIKYMSRIYSGGTLMFWKFVDLQVNHRFQELSPRDLETLVFVDKNRKTNKFFLQEETLKRIRNQLT